MLLLVRPRIFDSMLVAQMLSLAKVSNCSSITAQRGSVITEFLLVIPFLILVFSGVLGLGRLYAQLTWVANSAYEVALTGAGSPPNEAGEASMQTRTDLLGSIPYYSLIDAPSIQPLGQQLFYNQFPGNPQLNNTVLVKMDAELPVVFSRWVTTFSVSAVLPVLVLGRGNAGDLTQFANASCFYDCSGNVIDLGGGVCCQDPSCSVPASSCYP